MAVFHTIGVRLHVCVCEYDSPDVTSLSPIAIDQDHTSRMSDGD